VAEVKCHGLRPFGEVFLNLAPEEFCRVVAEGEIEPGGASNVEDPEEQMVLAGAKVDYCVVLIGGGVACEVSGYELVSVEPEFEAVVATEAGDECEGFFGGDSAEEPGGGLFHVGEGMDFSVDQVFTLFPEAAAVGVFGAQAGAVDGEHYVRELSGLERAGEVPGAELYQVEGGLPAAAPSFDAAAGFEHGLRPGGFANVELRDFG